MSWQRSKYLKTNLSYHLHGFRFNTRSFTFWMFVMIICFMNLYFLKLFFSKCRSWFIQMQHNMFLKILFQNHLKTYTFKWLHIHLHIQMITHSLTHSNDYTFTYTFKWLHIHILIFLTQEDSFEKLFAF